MAHDLTLSTRRARPLDVVTLSGLEPGMVSVRDGRGTEYVHGESDDSFRFTVSGALGTQLVMVLDHERRVREVLPLAVGYETEIDDERGFYRNLLGLLWTTMHKWWASNLPKYIRVGGKGYKYYVTWLRDHVHALNGMRYWEHEVKSGIELYADSQREDGMIWDKCKQMCHSAWQTFRDFEFAEGDFVRPIDRNNTNRRWMRIPVENDVEYLYIEGLYRAWKSCGDTGWMSGLLDSALRAVRYSTTDPYRWSEKFGLLKRGFTIDSWDFQSRDDAARSSTGTVMRIDLDTGEFNVFHGDNTGMARSLELLAEMLRAAGRDAEADEQLRLSRELRERLDEIAWNGEFYTHMVPENPGAQRDLGDTPVDRQVSLSNTHALNRGIPHEQAVAIIETYLRIRREMPETSAGEWYNIYPPFEKGFHFPKWEYMNGGVSTIAAGQLARGAFEHGYERYAVDILERVNALCEEYGGYLFAAFKGALPEPPPPAVYEPLSIEAFANTDTHGAGADGVSGWVGDPEDDMRHLPPGRAEYAGVPFDVIDPATNGRRAIVGLSQRDPYTPAVTVPVGRAARTVYFFHTAHGRDVKGWDKSTVAYSPHGATGAGVSPGPLVGTIRVVYEDGTHHTEYVHSHRGLESWRFPAPDAVGGHQIRTGNYRIGYQGPGGKYENTGVFVFGLEHPHPQKPIERIELEAAETDSIWLVAGLTLCDGPVSFPVTKISKGIPAMWGAADLVHAIVEGLAGIQDTGPAFERARIAPRWQAADVDRVTAGAVLPASGGYMRYRYFVDGDELAIEVAGSAAEIEADVLLPDRWQSVEVTVDGQPAEGVRVREVEGSRYAVFPLEGPAARSVRIRRIG